jgi:hypothetical protein
MRLKSSSRFGIRWYDSAQLTVFAREPTARKLFGGRQIELKAELVLKILRDLTRED